MDNLNDHAAGGNLVIEEAPPFDPRGGFGALWREPTQLFFEAGSPERRLLVSTADQNAAGVDGALLAEVQSLPLPRHELAELLLTAARQARLGSLRLILADG